MYVYIYMHIYVYTYVLVCFYLFKVTDSCVILPGIR